MAGPGHRSGTGLVRAGAGGVPRQVSPIARTLSAVLSIEDRFAIQDLYARYCANLDCGDWEAWSRCFTEDGVFTGFREVRGRAAIADYGRMRCEERPHSPWKLSQHWNNNLVVEGDGH